MRSTLRDGHLFPTPERPPSISRCRNSALGLVVVARMSRAVQFDEYRDIDVERADLEVPIGGIFPLDDVHAACRTREERHTRGKMVLLP